MMKFTVYFHGKLDVEANDIEEAQRKVDEELVGNPLNFDFCVLNGKEE